MRGIVLRESLVGGQLPMPMPAVVVRRYPYRLDGRLPVEVVELTVTTGRALAVAMQLAEALLPERFYAHLVDQSRMYVCFPDCVVLVRRGDNGVGPIAISPDGSRVALGGINSGSLSVWNLRKGQLLVTLSGHTEGLRSLAWTPDGVRLVSASNDGTVRLWRSRSSYNHEAELLFDKLSQRVSAVRRSAF